jgi:hypothetical protein
MMFLLDLAEKSKEKPSRMDIELLRLFHTAGAGQSYTTLLTWFSLTVPHIPLYKPFPMATNYSEFLHPQNSISVQLMLFKCPLFFRHWMDKTGPFHVEVPDQLKETWNEQLRVVLHVLVGSSMNL